MQILIAEIRYVEVTVEQIFPTECKLSRPEFEFETLAPSTNTLLLNCPDNIQPDEIHSLVGIIWSVKPQYLPIMTININSNILCIYMYICVWISKGIVQIPWVEIRVKRNFPTGWKLSRPGFERRTLVMYANALPLHYSDVIRPAIIRSLVGIDRSANPSDLEYGQDPRFK